MPNLKLEFEVTDLGECQIRLNGKDAVACQMSPGISEINLNHLPDHTVGKLVLEEAFDLAIKLIRVSGIAEGELWHKRDEATLNEVYDVL